MSRLYSRNICSHGGAHSTFPLLLAFEHQSRCLHCETLNDTSTSPFQFPCSTPALPFSQNEVLNACLCSTSIHNVTSIPTTGVLCCFFLSLTDLFIAHLCRRASTIFMDIRRSFYPHSFFSIGS